MKDEWTYDIEIGCVNGNDFWYFSLQFNGLFHLDLDKGLTEHLGCVPDEELYKERLYGSMHFWGGKIFLIPFAAKKIAVYDIEKKEFESIGICNDSNKAEYYDADYKWQDSILYDNKIYMFGLTHSSIGILDCLSMEFKADYAWINSFEKKFGLINKSKYEFYFEKNIVMDERCIFILLGFCNKIMKFDIDINEFYFCSIGNDENIFYNLSKIHDKFVMTYKNSRQGIVVWNWDTREIEEKIIEVDAVACANANAIPLCNSMIISSLNKQKGILYDFKTKEYRYVNYLDNHYCAYYYTETSNIVLIYYASINRLVQIDKNTMNYKAYKLYSDNNIFNIKKEKIKLEAVKNIISESKFSNLNDYISVLLEEEKEIS